MAFNIGGCVIQIDQVVRVVAAIVIGCCIAACVSKEAGVSVAADTADLIVQQIAVLPAAAANRGGSGGSLAFEKQIGVPLSKLAKRWENLPEGERVRFFPCQLAFIEHSAQVHDSFVAGKVIGHPGGDGKALAECVRLVLQAKLAASGGTNAAR